MNSLKIDKQALELARKQFCLDIGMPWEEYLENPRQQVYIRKAVYKEGTFLNQTEGARNYEGRDDFFHAMICLGQLFLIVDEQIYDWAVEKFKDYPVEWFCQYDNLRMIDEKLKEFGHKIRDTHVYFLPEQEKVTENDLQISEGTELNRAMGVMPVSGDGMGEETGDGSQLNLRTGTADEANQTALLQFCWYDQEGILRFKGNNRFTSAICFSQTQPDMLAVVALKDDARGACKIYDQSQMSGMAGVSADGAYLWQIGINVIPEETGKGLAAQLVRMLKDEVLRSGKIPFYGTSESHTVSQTVGLKAGFVPAWTEVFVNAVPEN